MSRNGRRGGVHEGPDRMWHWYVMNDNDEVIVSSGTGWLSRMRAADDLFRNYGLSPED